MSSLSTGVSARLSVSLESLKSLELGGTEGFEDTFFPALGGGDGFPELRRLTIPHCYPEYSLIGLGQLRAPQLTSLSFSKFLTSNDLEGLVSLPLSQISTLRIPDTRLPSGGLRQIVDEGMFVGIRELDLSRCQIPMSDIEKVFENDQLRSCEHLALHGAVEWRGRREVTRFIERLAECESLAGLNTLELGDLRTSELRILAECEYLRNLRALSVDGSVVTPADARSLARSAISRSLRKLSLVAARIDTEAMTELCQGSFPSLVSLELSGDFDGRGRIHEDAVITAVRSGAFPELRELSLDNLALTDKTLIAITDDSRIPELRHLSFRNNSATQKVVRSVFNSERISKLRLLDVRMPTGMNDRPMLAREFGRRIRI